MTLVRLLILMLAWHCLAACLPLSSGAMAMPPAAEPRDAIAPVLPRAGRARPLVAVLAQNRHTELADLLVPVAVLREADAADVAIVATGPGRIMLVPAMQVEADMTLAGFDAAHPEGPDVVVVPAVHDPADATLLAWIRRQAARGARIMGICDGAQVLAHAGLLDGRAATIHWYSLNDMRKSFKTTRWTAHARYLEDGNVVTTSGVTAAVPASLALVEAIAGPAHAAATARRIGLSTWTARHDGSAFRLAPRHLLAAARGWLTAWPAEAVPLPVGDGVDEIALALTADAYSRSYRSRAVAVGPAAHATGRRGIRIVADRVEPQPRTHAILRPPAQGIAPLPALDAALANLAAAYGRATAELVALQLEHPWPGAPERR